MFHRLGMSYRTLLRKPALQIGSVVLVGLAIAVQTAVFAAVTTVLRRPLPFADADRLVSITERKLGVDTSAETTFGNYYDWQTRGLPFTAIGGYASSSPVLFQGDLPKSLEVTRATTSFFKALRVNATRGRTFAPDEEVQSARVAMLSHAAWTQLFGRRDDVIGSTVELDGVRYAIVGVAPPEVALVVKTDVFVPFPRQFNGRGQRVVRVVARLAEGVTATQAQGSVNGVVAALEPMYRDNEGFRSASVVPLRDHLLDTVRRPIVGFGVLAVFVLLAVLVNLVSLQFVRLEWHARDLAIRAALGATRRQLLLHAAAESMIVALGGLAVGMTFAWWLVSIAKRLSSNAITQQQLSIEPTALVVAAVLACGIGAVAGLGAALGLIRQDLSATLRESTTSVGSGRGARRTQAVALVLQTSCAFLFVAVALTVVSEVWRLVRTNPGFDTRDLWTVDIKTMNGQRGNVGDQGRQYAELADTLKAVPGIVSAGAINSFPLTGLPATLPLHIRDMPTSGSEVVQLRITTPGYFETMRVPLRSGRLFTMADDRTKPLVVVVNEAIVDRYWAGRQGIDREVRVATSPWFRVIGVVANVRAANPSAAPEPELYLTPLQASSSGEMTFAIRSQPGVVLSESDVRATIRRVAPALAVARVATVESLLSESRRPQQIGATFLTALSIVAVALALAASYGIVSYAVAGRRRELALRRALGANDAQIIWTVTAQTFGLILIGLAGGAGLTMVLGRLYTSSFQQARGLEAPMLAGGAILLLALMGCATYIPARRAVTLPVRDVLQMS